MSALYLGCAFNAHPIRVDLVRTIHIIGQEIEVLIRGTGRREGETEEEMEGERKERKENSKHYCCIVLHDGDCIILPDISRKGWG